MYCCNIVTFSCYVINIILQEIEENIVYAVIGPFSSNRLRTLETLNFDEDRVEYAKINYNIIVPQNPTLVSAEKTMESDEGIIEIYTLILMQTHTHIMHLSILVLDDTILQLDWGELGMRCCIFLLSSLY